MRVTLGLQARNVLRYLDGASERIVNAQAHAVAGKRIIRGSDDVPGTSRAMTLRSTLAGIKQFQENSTMAASLLTTTDAGLGELSSILQDVRRIAVAASSTMADEARQGYATELEGILRRMADIGNTQQADRYIFAGQMTNTKPFVPGVPPALYDYMGDGNYNSIWIQNGTYVEVNVPGDEVFNMGGVALPGDTDMFTMVEDLKNLVIAGDSVATSNMIDDIDRHIGNVLSIRAEVGARAQRVEANLTVLLTANEQMSELLSKTEDMDLPTAVIELKTSENIYQAALAVTSRIMELSLANYLK